MTRTSIQRFVTYSWMIALLIGLIFAGLEYGVRFEIVGANASDAPSWLDLALLLGAYLFVFCLKPIQSAIQRKLCQRATHRTHQKVTR
ncbi:hypothetical protein [Pseudomonas fildesensis]|uniref:Uncharacterized protein n=1 Tax=Pseudomonas fildesensis TaxID=1674920 RepID=A0A0J8G8K8_9PSED|nr:hypothetical protein [Pseudomonas fildesensis]KMT57073.1 hypothetical protein ACR52_00175 [Pseudomonas fildesensis]